MAGSLENVRVLELTRNVAGPYAAKLLADQGADVIKLEPPGGDDSRAFGPFPGNEAHPERSGLFLHLNRNKKSIVVDPASPDGAATIRRLAARAHVVLEDYPAGSAEAWGWGWNTLRAANPALVLASITPFGQSGPYRDYRGSELTLQAAGGPLITNGHEAREPLKLAGHYAHYHAAMVAAVATPDGVPACRGKRRRRLDRRVGVRMPGGLPRPAVHQPDHRRLHRHVSGPGALGVAHGHRRATLPGRLRQHSREPGTACRACCG